MRLEYFFTFIFARNNPELTLEKHSNEWKTVKSFSAFISLLFISFLLSFSFTNNFFLVCAPLLGEKNPSRAGS